MVLFLIFCKDVKVKGKNIYRILKRIFKIFRQKKNLNFLRFALYLK
ncbi:hypothetical protein BHF72_2534 [Cloacibacterium normanense]|uniref:Uncharacterized protein n=1 Tax=Cloacibacterium normanense TaxID=237258 RepID=A0A1E5UE48_9FLAO|nr:hypothetical protein BHF72_2534 [Cloacibacterium normanense]